MNIVFGGAFKVLHVGGVEVHLEVVSVDSSDSNT